MDNWLIKCEHCGGDNCRENDSCISCNKTLEKAPRLYKFQPFATDKQIGREYNGHCQLVPNNDDWILILDYDCQILCPQTYQVIENAIKRYPDTAIFGALCNRVAYSHQRIMKSPD